MSKIESAIKQAVATFSKPQCGNRFQESLSSLMQTVNQLKLDDLFIDKEMISFFDQNVQSRYYRKSNILRYIQVYEDENVTASIFVLKSNSVIPLHDHPLMHGIIKVIYGSVRIQSYTLLEGKIKQKRSEEICRPSELFYMEDPVLYDSNLVGAIKNPPKIVSDRDECVCLSPLENNLHEVSSHNGPSAFLDILAPRYETKVNRYLTRDCTYFIETKSVFGSKTMLKKLNAPPDYETSLYRYNGPPINI